MDNVLAVLPGLPAVGQLAAFGALLGALLRVLYTERRDLRAVIDRKDQRITQLEELVDAERARRRAAEDAAAQAQRRPDLRVAREGIPGEHPGA